MQIEVLDSERETGTEKKRFDPYEAVTTLILKQLENGTVPWRCPWSQKVGRPRNFHTGNVYQGINTILLGFRRYASPYWLTIRQANMLGGHVRKGEHGSMVVKYGQFEKNSEEADDDKKALYYLRGYTVFNAIQIEGIDFPAVENGTSKVPVERVAVAEKIVADMPRKPAIEEGKRADAWYSPKRDVVQMPALSRFENSEAYYLTLFHELVHATGHGSRLNRKTLVESDGMLGKKYSKEELVAEMGAAFLGMEADIVTDDHEQSASYLKGWLDVLREPDHRRWIVEAGNQATKAAQFILGTYVPPGSECIVA